jgi:hypothetical protein
MKFAAHAALVVVLAFGAASAFAADTAPAKSLTPQQSKMGMCSKDAHAKGLKGAEYKSFMSTCLKADSAAAAPAAAPAKPATQQEKMKTCNADASTKHLKGVDRKTFMSTCLKGDGSAAAAH